jgi:hypothetical protein
MTKEIKVPELGHPKDVLWAILKDAAWFSVLAAELVIIDPRRKPETRSPVRLEGLQTAEDLAGYLEDDALKEEVIGLSGTVHDPNEGWELPVNVSESRVLLPERTSEPQMESIMKRLRTYGATAPSA